MRRSYFQSLPFQESTSLKGFLSFVVVDLLFDYRIWQNSQDLLYLILKRNSILKVFCWFVLPYLTIKKTKWKNFGFIPFHITQLKGSWTGW